MTEQPVSPPGPAWPHVITDPAGFDTDEQWSNFVEGREHGVLLSTIHLRTSVVGFGPPLHQHPYTEVIKTLRGRAVFTVGTEQIPMQAGQTAVIPPNTPHTFRTLGPERYESFAMHLSAQFVSEDVDPGLGAGDPGA